MNDRVSKKPPSVYMREEEAIDRYTTSAGATAQSGHRSDADILYDAGIASSKPSSMFRFGKAIVNAFNPANVWQGINGMWKEAEDSQSPGKSALQERQAKAEKAYADLKKSGFKGTKAPPARRASEDLPAIRYENVAEVPQEATFRDSGIDMDGYRSSTERSKNDQVFTRAKGLMPPPPLPASGRSPSPMIGMSSADGSSLSLHKPSFHNLKKVKSHFHMSPAKRAQSEISLPLPSTEIDASASTTSITQTLRNQPSKKDLVKQQKLSKRVSDLETKLEKARRELDGLQEPSNLGLKPFKPGALPSLPSQRVLEDHGSNEAKAGKEVDIKSNTTKPPTSLRERYVEREVSAQLETELMTSVSKGSLSKKRKSSDTVYKPSFSDDAADSDYKPTKKSVPKSGSVRSRKSQKIANDVPFEPVKVKNVRKFTPNGPRRISSQKMVNPMPPPHANSPRETIDPVPPLPATPKVFDTTKIDQAKILSMRSIPNGELPFGTFSDDIINLRAVYPSMTEGQLVAYIANLPANKKKTDHMSLSHHDCPASPFLAPPLSASPKKPQIRRTKRGISPPPPSMVSPKRPAIKAGDEGEEDAVTIRSEGNDTVAPLPEDILKSKKKAPVKHADKPLPGIQKEDYEWPEDVF